MHCYDWFASRIESVVSSMYVRALHMQNLSLFDIRSSLLSQKRLWDIISFIRIKKWPVLIWFSMSSKCTQRHWRIKSETGDFGNERVHVITMPLPVDPAPVHSLVYCVLCQSNSHPRDYSDELRIGNNLLSAERWPEKGSFYNVYRITLSVRYCSET